MTSNSEARKRQHEAEMALAAHERRREVAQQALERIYSGAGFAEADALLDGFSDLGASLSVSEA